MLVVLSMLIMKTGDPRNWSWLTNETAKPTTDPAAPPPPLPKATGPTEEDPDEKDMAQREFPALTDGTVGLRMEEMSLYDRMVFWVKYQSFERLYQRAKKNLWYTDLYDAPDKHRGELVVLNLEILRANSKYEDRYDFKLAEVWGQTEESRNRLYVLIVLDYPQGMPEGYDLHEKAKFVGYFLKLHGYHPGDDKPGARPEKAPLLIGRLEWEPSPMPERNSAQEWFWGLMLLAILGLVLGVRFVYFKLRGKDKTSRPGMAFAPTGEVIPIDVWLEKSNFSTEESGTHPEGEDENQRGSNLPEET
jgi:hypothetical protein